MSEIPQRLVEPYVTPLSNSARPLNPNYGCQSAEDFYQNIKAVRNPVVVFMGGPGSGKTRLAAECIKILEEIADPEGWWGRKENYPIKNLYYIPLEGAQRLAANWNIVVNPPGFQSERDYKDSSQILTRATIAAIEQGGITIKEGPGLCNRAEVDYRQMARHEGLYQNSNYSTFFFLVLASDDIIGQAEEERAEKEFDINFQDALQSTRGGSFKAFFHYYKEEATYLNSIVDTIKKLNKADTPFQFRWEGIKERWDERWRTIYKRMTYSDIFLVDRDFRMEFIAKYFPTFYFRSNLNISDEEAQTNVYIAQNINTPSPRYDELLDRYDIFLNLEKHGHFKRRRGFYTTFHPDPLFITPIQSFYSPTKEF